MIKRVELPKGMPSILWMQRIFANYPLYQNESYSIIHLVSEFTMLAIGKAEYRKRLQKRQKGRMADGIGKIFANDIPRKLGPSHFLAKKLTNNRIFVIIYIVRDWWYKYVSKQNYVDSTRYFGT